MDTMFISSDFVEGSECEKSVFCFALAEGNKPLSIFRDRYCEELAYPGIFCGEEQKIHRDMFLCITAIFVSRN